MSWVVALACARGLVTSRAVFLRTPKRRSDEASLLRAMLSSRAETLLAAGAGVCTVLMIATAPSWTTVALGLLLLFQGWLYTAAPWASMAAEGITLTPTRRAYLRSSQNTGDRPARSPAAVAVGTTAVLVAAGAAIGALVASSPSTTEAPFTRGPSDLPRIGALAPPASPTAAPSATPSPESTSSATSTSSSSTAAASPTAAPTAQSTAQASASP
jgi:hypothetical protein